MITNEHGVFKNLAELKEDALRHINPFQCNICGKRFGKRYGKDRHKEIQKAKCVPVGNDKTVVWVSRELEEAILDLENAKGCPNVISAINKCKELFNFTEGTSAMGPPDMARPQESTNPNSTHYPAGQ